jgi:hypothetical protein
MACGPAVVTLLNWTPIFEWYMARLVLRMDTKKTCYGICTWEGGEITFSGVIGLLNRTRMFEWYMAMFVIKDGH